MVFAGVDYNQDAHSGAGQTVCKRAGGAGEKRENGRDILHSRRVDREELLQEKGYVNGT